MSRNYLSASDFGRAISAEELAALAGTGRGSAQAQETAAEPCDCGCGETPSCPQAPQAVCCWQVRPQPRPVPGVNEGCCCKQSFRAALEVLCDSEISDLLDFNAAAFLTDQFVAGTTLAAPPAEGETISDNLGTSLTGTFRRFSACGRDLLDIDAVPYYPAPGGATTLPITAGQVSVCALSAVVIGAEAAAAEGELTADEAAARDFRRLKRLISARLDPCGGTGCGQTGCACPADSGECCCVSGVMSALSGSNLSRRVTLTAGWLVLNNAELLGTVGNVLVLAADDTRRVYFVCAEKVGFLA